MQRDRPTVTVVYQDPPTHARMGCVEVVVSVIVLAAMGVAAGWIAWPWW